MTSPISKLQDLKRQRAELEALIAAETAAALDDAFTQIDALVEVASITKEQIAKHFNLALTEKPAKKTSSADTGSKRKPVEVKYEREGVTWTGRGKMPKSYRLALETDPSLTIESFRINK